MAAAAEIDLGQFTRGDTIYLPFTFDSEGVGVDLRGQTVWFTMKLSPYEEDVDAAVQIVMPLALDDSEAEAGRFTVTIPSDQSAQIMPGNYHYDLQLVTPGAPPGVMTYLIGRIEIRVDVTHGV